MSNDVTMPGTHYADGELDTDEPVLLRIQLQKIIRDANGDAAKAALAICLMLEDEMDLAEKGWFDNDLVVQEAMLADDD